MSTVTAVVAGISLKNTRDCSASRCMPRAVCYHTAQPVATQQNVLQHSRHVRSGVWRSRS